MCMLRGAVLPQFKFPLPFSDLSGGENPTFRFQRDGLVPVYPVLEVHGLKNREDLLDRFERPRMLDDRCHGFGLQGSFHFHGECLDHLVGNMGLGWIEL